MGSYDDFMEGVGHRLAKELADELVTEIKLSVAAYEAVDTGRLRDSFHVREDVNGYSISSDVEYWADVEYGHWPYNQYGGPYEPKVAARPFVGTAVEIVRARHQ